jgi:pimeloyl-ACP methyl ester carboxylesterase
VAPRPASHGRALSGFGRRFALSPRYAPEETLDLRTSDGLRLAGARLAGPPDAYATVVFLHGLVHSSRNPRVHAFARLLAREVHVLVPDMRGHGRSEGVCTLGRDEPLDVAAAVAAAPRGLPVVTVGVSLGGAAVLLHAGASGGVAGVVAISAPAWSDRWDTAATVRVRRYTSSRAGRLFVARVLRTRMAPFSEWVAESSRLVADIAPAFTLVIHDPADHYFGEEHARSLYRWAREPKDLWLLPGTGHGTDLLGPALADRLLAYLRDRLAG